VEVKKLENRERGKKRGWEERKGHASYKAFRVMKIKTS
jgi:hypothetical protein